MSVFVTTGFYITDKAGAHLDAMIASGLWGDTEGQVLSMLLYQGIQDAVANGLISTKLAQVADAPLPAEAPPPRPDCAACDNGNKFNCAQTADYKCVECGRDVEIPF